MTALIGPLISLGVQLISWWIGMKGKASELDKRWLAWLKKKNEESTKSVEIQEKIEKALKWAENNPIK